MEGGWSSGGAREIIQYFLEEATRKRLVARKKYLREASDFNAHSPRMLVLVLVSFFVQPRIKVLGERSNNYSATGVETVWYNIWRYYAKHNNEL